MKCPQCGNELTDEMIEANLCWECGRILDLDQVGDDEIVASAIEREKQYKEEQSRQETSKRLQGEYEYYIERIANDKSGHSNLDMIFDVLNKKAAEGWKLHTIYSNEIGKNVIAIAGAGTNRTISEDIMVFERRIR